MKRSVVIVGAGGFGREVYCLIRALQARGQSWDVLGFLDDAPSALNTELVARLGSKILGPVNHARHLGPIAAVAAIGSGQIRQEVVARLHRFVAAWPVLVHPEATIGLDNKFGPGTIIAAGARITTNVHCGRHVQIDQNVTVGHDCRIGEFSRLNPQSCISGSVCTGSNVEIGANAVVLPGVAVENNSRVGAGAVVVRDVPAKTTVKGVPAR